MLVRADSSEHKTLHYKPYQSPIYSLNGFIASYLRCTNWSDLGEPMDRNKVVFRENYCALYAVARCVDVDIPYMKTLVACYVVLPNKIAARVLVAFALLIAR